MSVIPSSDLGQALVTGGSGFIGRQLVSALIEQGHKPVVLSRRERPADYLPEQLDCFHWIKQDTDTTESLVSRLQAFGVQTVYHLAGARGRGSGISAWEGCVEANVAATVRILCAASLAGVHRVVTCGSAAEYGAQQGPFSEELAVQPTSAYGAAKAAATLIATSMQAALQTEVVVLRLFTVYGPGQPADMFVAEALEAAAKGNAFPMSQGLHRTDLVYVDDAVRALLAAGSCAGIAGLVINIGSGRDYALREVAETIWRLTNCQAPLQIGQRNVAVEYRHNTSANIRRARDLLGWQPAVSLAEGLQRSLVALGLPSDALLSETSCER